MCHEFILDPVGRLARHFDADWFHPGEDGIKCKYGLKAENIVDAIQALKSWLLPTAGKNKMQDPEREKLPWHASINFYYV